LFPVKLEDLVFPNHFISCLERVLDIGFVRHLVRDAYAERRQPSINPEVVFTLHLFLFCE
jgi:hypothetical protein